MDRCCQIMCENVEMNEKKRVSIESQAVFNELQKGDLILLKRDLYFWKTPDMETGKRIDRGNILFFLGTSIGYVGMQCEVVEFAACLVNKEVLFFQYAADTFFVYWTNERIKEIEQKVSGSLWAEAIVN